MASPLYDHSCADRLSASGNNTQVKRFSKAMKAPLIFCSTSHLINVQKVFKIVLSKVRANSDPGLTPGGRGVLPFRPYPSGLAASTDWTEGSRAPYTCAAQAFDLKCTIPEITKVGEPLLIYLDVGLCAPPPCAWTSGPEAHEFADQPSERRPKQAPAS